MALSMTITEDKAMNEIIRAVAITTEDQALVWITDALDKGNFSKEADCYRLAEKFELDLEPIQAAWNEKRREAKARLALDHARLNNLSERLAKVKPKIDALKLTATKEETSTIAKDAIRPAASTWRRPLPPETKASLFLSRHNQK
jgi:hypothetical protein